LLLAVGLAVSIPIVIAGAALVTELLDRVPLLVWAGSALLGWVAGQTIISDAMVARLVAGTGKPDSSLEWIAGGAGAVLAIVLGGLWRRRRLANSAAAPRDRSI